MISNLDFPKFEDDPVEDEEKQFVRKMRNFQREMERKSEKNGEEEDQVGVDQQ